MRNNGEQMCWGDEGGTDRGFAPRLSAESLSQRYDVKRYKFRLDGDVNMSKYQVRQVITTSLQRHN